MLHALALRNLTASTAAHHAKAPAKRDPKIDDKVGVPLHLEKHRIKSGAQMIRVIVDQKPYRAGIDPLHKLIDRITSDNTVGVRDRTIAAASAGRKGSE